MQYITASLELELMTNKPMFNKLAILLVGAQNTGKTSTLREYCEYYENITLGSRFRKGWRWQVAPFRPNYSLIKTPAYFVQSSPTESAKPLADSIDPLGWFPDLLFVAEQLNGQQYTNTVTYLRANDYHIKEFVLSDTNGIDIWDRWRTNAEKDTKLLYRREAIADYIRNFILSKI